MGILYLDHEVNNLNSFKAAFRREAMVFIAETTDMAISILENNKIEIIFADHHMPEMTGLDFLRLVATRFPDSKRVILTGNAYTDEFRAAAQKGIFHRYVNKPWDEQQLRTLMETL
ncbi:response regulator [Dyadobacter sandarakinus]|uniref:Response regulator n=1 Tax=Dyadobacter sandarakinus TaxID=2747268 RepID=A0ABX7I5Y0_9BACT|nr:response regulator [Dyadobacter sandarakinus]QRR01138.1 response regulator [Dyadobacter sandarakinus]